MGDAAGPLDVERHTGTRAGLAPARGRAARPVRPRPDAPAAARAAGAAVLRLGVPDHQRHRRPVPDGALRGPRGRTGAGDRPVPAEPRALPGAVNEEAAGRRERLEVELEV